jgi:hypothetical protein
MRVARAFVLLLLFAALCRLPAGAQNPPDIDKLLEWQDRMVLATYQQSYIRDNRYDAVLSRISARLNPHLREVYPSYRRVGYYVFVGRMGFNAQTWNNIIIFDSLLLDAMRNLANGIAVYGSTDCDYVHTLAQYVARADAACHSGRLMLDLSNANNPYHLPTIWGLTPAQRQQADALFEEMLAAWMAHEGSHAFLQHTRERVQAQALLSLYRQREVPQEEIRKYISDYLSYDTTRQKEREADIYGVRLIIKSGYDITGLIDTFEFAQMIEDLTGRSGQPDRTHPSPAERIQLARQIEAEVTHKTPDAPEARPKGQ